MPDLLHTTSQRTKSNDKGHKGEVMDADMIAVFKSIPEMYDKEKSGAKPNTLRKIDPKDDRFKYLKRGGKRIRIRKSDMSESFERYITDYTEWEGWAIISWKQK